MARHLIAAGHRVTVWNRTRAREEPLAALGAARATCPAGAAAGADVVLTCVSEDPDTEQVVFGPQGVASPLTHGAVLVDCTSGSPSMALDLARRLGYQGALFVDAPVCGDPADAADATLTVFAGGTDTAVAKAMPVLNAIATQVTHIGPAGSGQAAKAVSQVVLAGVYAGVAEGAALAMRLGLPEHVLLHALTTGEGDAWVLRNHAAATATQPPGLPPVELLKDLRLAIGEADGIGVPLDTARTITGIHEDMIQTRLRDHHFPEDPLEDHLIDTSGGARLRVDPLPVATSGSATSTGETSPGAEPGQCTGLRQSPIRRLLRRVMARDRT